MPFFKCVRLTFTRACKWGRAGETERETPTLTRENALTGHHTDTNRVDRQQLCWENRLNTEVLKA
jgi:hypothetical protein